MRTISAFEFARRFHHSVTNHDGRFVWFLGAGCSVSSGIEDASETARRWLKELKYLETGDNDAVDEWLTHRFPAFKEADSAALYGPVLRALFYTAQEQERELERINASAEPGFGYATLAQLVTHPRWGERFNTLITTNFDDLVAEALYIYSQRRPQVLTHESFDRRIRISDARPTIVKIYGDAHLQGAGQENTESRLRGDVMDRLRAQMTESALLLIGYGGRDESVAELLEGLPPGAPAGGLYWVNAVQPAEPLREWLDEHSAVHVSTTDFEGLMFLIRNEFELGHPRIDRFDQILKRYDEQYRVLADRPDLQTTSGKRFYDVAAEPALPTAPRKKPASTEIAERPEQIADAFAPRPPKAAPVLPSAPDRSEVAATKPSMPPRGSDPASKPDVALPKQAMAATPQPVTKTVTPRVEPIGTGLDAGLAIPPLPKNLTTEALEGWASLPAPPRLRVIGAHCLRHSKPVMLLPPKNSRSHSLTPTKVTATTRRPLM